MLSVRTRRAAGRIRTGTAGITTSDAAVYTTATTTAGTTGLEPAASRLTSERSRTLSYAPRRERIGRRIGAAFGSAATGGRDVAV